ncbi:MAG: hypothetical protein ACI4OS_00545 [Akkermansia sp.]
MTEPEQKLNTAAPAPLPEGLRMRLLEAMQDVSAREAEDARTEALLRRLSPAPLPTALSGRLAWCLGAVAREARDARRAARRRYVLPRAAAAVAALLAVGGPLTMALLPASAGNASGLMSRCVLESRGSERVQWQDGAPLRAYEVTYEDSFVMDAEEDVTVVVRVPNRATVRVEEEWL